VTVSRGNFIIHLLVEIDRSAELEKFDEPMRVVLAAPQPEPVGKTQEVPLVEDPWQGRDAIYRQTEAEGLCWPDAQAPQQKSLELELQDLRARPQKPGVREYGLNREREAFPEPPQHRAVEAYHTPGRELEAFPVPPQRQAVQAYHTPGRELEALPGPPQHQAVQAYRPPNRDFEAFPVPPRNQGVQGYAVRRVLEIFPVPPQNLDDRGYYAPNRDLEAFPTPPGHQGVRRYAPDREFESLPAPPQHARARGYAPNRGFEALPAPPQHAPRRGYAPDEEFETLPAQFQRPGSRGYAPNRGSSGRSKSTQSASRPVLETRTKLAAAGTGWLNLAAVFVSGAIIGLAGYAYLQQGHKLRDAGLRDTGKARPAALPASTMAVPSQPVVATSQAVGANSSFSGVTQAANRAPQEVASSQAHYDNGAANRAAHETLAWPAREAVSEPAPVQTRHAAVPKPQPVQESPPEMSDDELLEQAASRLQSGDLQGARTAYKAVAGHGNMKGAFSLAQTYDPDFLAAQRIRGAKPDSNLARRWYEKAAKLGDPEASARLKELKALQDNSTASDVLRR
jgi:hypothetical protein